MEKNKWELCEKHIPDDCEQLGAIYSTKNDNVHFSVWAPLALSVDVLLYRDSRENRYTVKLPLEYCRKTGVWSGELTGQQANKDNLLLDGAFYEYYVTTEQGTKKCLDPYALSMAVYKNDNTSGRAAIVDLENPKAKSKFATTSGTELTTGEAESITSGTNLATCSISSTDKVSCTMSFHRNDAIIYEVSVRDFSIDDKDSLDSCAKCADKSNLKTGAKGTYLSFIEKLPYIASLGVTHIQLMPVLNFYHNDETNQGYESGIKTKDCNYNWGYDPHNYFTPEGWYSTEPENPYSRISELRTLVDAIHSAGLYVILDCVYNHMAKTDFLEDIVKGYYFRLNDDDSFKSGSCCGNDIASEHKMARRLIVDSIKHWVKNYNVDGFRFDLMGLIDSETILASYKAATSIKRNMLFIGEGWKMYNGEFGTVGLDQNYMTKTNDIAVFNDEFRDLLKAGGMNEDGLGFVTGKPVDKNQLFMNLTGRPQQNYTVDSPSDNVQYIDCHDGFTLHDCIANNAHIDTRTKSGQKELIARIKLANSMLLTSQGIVFLHAGQECGRTKNGVNTVVANSDGTNGNVDSTVSVGPDYVSSLPETIGRFVRNSYKSSDDVNKFDWSLPNKNRDILEYTKGLITLRRENIVFRLRSLEEIQEQIKMLDTSDSKDELCLSYAIHDAICGEKGKCWFLVFNACLKDIKVRLMSDFNNNHFEPAKELNNLKVFADSKRASNIPWKLSESSVVLDDNGMFTVPALSAFICQI